jgi:gliding motility-associated lipoprotein GldH
MFGLRKCRFIGVFFLIVGMASCRSESLVDVFETVPVKGWGYDSLVIVDVPNHVFQQKAALTFNLRHHADYAYANFYARIIQKHPSGQRDTILVDVPTATIDGRWLGKGVGVLYTIQYPVKTPIVLADTGIYQFYVQHYMRDHSLQGIQDVGIRLDPVPNP